MSDNPFAEPDDDRTVFRPMPGGRPGTASRPPPKTAPPPPAAAPPPIPPGADLQTLVGAFNNRLIAAAAPLLQLLARLRNTAAPPDQGDMRDRTAREMREFERRARDAGVPMEEMRPAHYALCASLDDVVLNTPWGAHGSWRDRTLCSTFHGENGVGEGFFDQIRIMRSDPARHLPVLELMYLCLALGFMGRFRAAPDGVERIERVREQTHDLLLQARGPPPASLSDHWQGVDAPYRTRRTRFPVWVAASIALAALAGGFVWTLNEANQRSDQLLGAALRAQPAAMPAMLRPPSVRPPPPPPEPPPGPANRLAAALAAEIGRNEVLVVASPSATVLRLPVKTLFAGPVATLSKDREALLARIGVAISDLPGPVQVIGYTDNVPLRTVKFPSNFALSKARAEAVRDALARTVRDKSRLSAEGRADAEPLAPNTTQDGREQNRRVDIVLPR